MCVSWVLLSASGGYNCNEQMAWRPKPDEIILALGTQSEYRDFPKKVRTIYFSLSLLHILHMQQSHWWCMSMKIERYISSQCVAVRQRYCTRTVVSKVWKSIETISVTHPENLVTSFWLSYHQSLNTLKSPQKSIIFIELKSKHDQTYTQSCPSTTTWIQCPFW